jgi:hypothetical protein
LLKKNLLKYFFGTTQTSVKGLFQIFRNQDKRTVYTAVGGNEARGGALLLTWLEENYEAVRQFYGDTFVTNVKTMLRGFPEESSTEEDHQRLQARIDNELHLTEQCCGSGSGSAGTVCFYTSWIRLRQ